MREIKFRQPEFEQGIFKRFHYWGFVRPREFTGVIPPIEIAHEQSQQFTGLLDKAGREIYEGDLIKAEGEEGLQEWTIIFADGRFCAHNDRDMIGLHYWDAQEMNIIGSIYENPELLEGK
jgi:hypothetical protein